jgi:hypothetical protein
MSPMLFLQRGLCDQVVELQGRIISDVIIGIFDGTMKKGQENYVL